MTAFRHRPVADASAPTAEIEREGKRLPTPAPTPRAPSSGAGGLIALVVFLIVVGGVGILYIVAHAALGIGMNH